MDDKEKKLPEAGNKSDNNASDSNTPGSSTWVDDMKQELEDYIEEQGIYIRQ